MNGLPLRRRQPQGEVRPRGGHAHNVRGVQRWTGLMPGRRVVHGRMPFQRRLRCLAVQHQQARAGADGERGDRTVGLGGQGQRSPGAQGHAGDRPGPELRSAVHAHGVTRDEGTPQLMSGSNGVRCTSQPREA